MNPCPVCGNDIESGVRLCRYCGTAVESDGQSSALPTALHKSVNLEHGRPTVETAMTRLDQALLTARSQRVRVVTLIHGYGSSGRGGKIRLACRRMLDHLVRQGKLEGFIEGERFNRRHGPGKALLRRYPGLAERCRSDLNNPGVTIAVL